MSVINQMLVDLERRRASGEPPSADGPAPSGPSAPSDN